MSIFVKVELEVGLFAKVLYFIEMCYPVGKL